MRSFNLLFVGAISALSIAPISAGAATLLFDTDPFVGTAALTTPGRQVVMTNERFVSFDVLNDVAAVSVNAFDFDADGGFFNGFAAGLPTGGLSFIVLQDLDSDGNPANGLALNAGQAANLIAAEIDTAGAGFFVYFNQGLQLNRLVYSTDLSDPTADLSVIARFTNQTGADGIAALPRYTAANFAVVPAPAMLGLFGLGFAGLAVRRRTA